MSKDSSSRLAKMNARLKILEAKHRAIDAEIVALEAQPRRDNLLLKQKKTLRLRYKDELTDLRQKISKLVEALAADDRQTMPVPTTKPPRSIRVGY